jgi:flagellar protein FlaG
MSISLNSDANVAALAGGAAARGAPALKVDVPAVPAVAQKPVTKAEPLYDPDQLRKNLHEAVENLNRQVERNGRGLNFSFDERLDRPVITVRNTATGDIVRQIPNEVIVRVAHSIEDLKGLLLDHTL